jgi:hypothetical protein
MMDHVCIPRKRNAPSQYLGDEMVPMPDAVLEPPDQHGTNLQDMLDDGWVFTDTVAGLSDSGVMSGCAGAPTATFPSGNPLNFRVGPHQQYRNTK